jgi:ABC-type oligopeptide transport system substrate-binding subunit
LGDTQVERVQFVHVLFQHYLCDTLTQVECRHWHAETAAALEALYGPASGEAAVTLAYHHAEAGHARQAAAYLLQAGDRARILYAHEAAARHYQQALPLLHKLNDAEAEARTQLKLGLVHTIAFDYPRAREAYDAGFRLWQAVGAGRPVPHLPPAPHPLRLVWRDPVNLDPTMAGTNLEAPIVTQLLSGLVNQSPEMEVVPDVAERWEVLDDGCRYVFHLRRDVYWSDGVPVTAADFEFTFKRALDPATHAPVAGMLLHPVRGAVDFNLGRTTHAAQVGVRAEGDYTFVIELDAPCSYLLQVLSYYVLNPVPRHVVLAHGAAWAEPPHFVGNGPFVLEHWTRGAGMRLKRNPRYHGRFGGNVEQVRLLPQVPPEQEFDLYSAGELDVVYNWFYLATLIDALRRRHPEEYSRQPRFVVFYTMLDATQPPFHDRRVRLALALALDRTALVRQQSGDYEVPGIDGFVPPGMPGHSPGIGLPHDPEAARRLLAEAGFGAGRPLPPITLMVGPSRLALAEAIAETWRRELGCEVNIVVATGSILAAVSAHRPQVALGGWWADYADPENFLRVCVQLDLPPGWLPAYDQLLEQARSLTDQTERMGAYQAADRLLMESGLIVPILYSPLHMMLKPWVRSFNVPAVKNPGFWKDVILEPHS